MNAGTLSNFWGGGGSSGASWPIGSMMAHFDGAPVITLGDGSVWLKAGYALPPSQVSPICANLPWLYVHGNAGITLSGTLTDINSAVYNPVSRGVFAHGRYLVTDGASGNVRSLVSGATAFTDVASNLGGGVNASCIATSGTETVVFTNTTAASRAVSRTTNGTSFTLVSASALPANWGTAGTGDCIRAGGLFVAAAINASAATDAIATSTDGTSWTARTLPSYTSGSSLGRVVHNGSLFMAMSDAPGNTGFYWTSPDAITWTRRTAPVTLTTANICNHFSATNGVFYYGTSGNAGFVSTDGINWSAVTRGTVTDNRSSNISGGITMTAGGLFVTIDTNSTSANVIWTSRNAINWDRRGTAGTNQLRGIYTGGPSALLVSSTVAACRYGSFPAPDAYGLANGTAWTGTGLSNVPQANYVRVR